MISSAESDPRFAWPDRRQARQLLGLRLLTQACLCAAGTIQAYGVDVAHSKGQLLPITSLIFSVVAATAAIGMLTMTPSRGWRKGRTGPWPRELRALVRAAGLPERPAVLTALALAAGFAALLISDLVIFTIHL